MMSKRKNLSHGIEINKSRIKKNNGYQQFIKAGVLDGNIPLAIPDSRASLSTAKDRTIYEETGEKSEDKFQSAL